MTELVFKPVESEIKNYFLAVLELKQSGEEFPVNLEDVWALVYNQKSDCVKVLKKHFIEDVDFQALRQNPQRGAASPIDYKISVSCLEFLVARKKREVFEVYRQVFHQAIEQAALPKSYSEALRALAEEVEAKEKLALENEEMKPKVEYHDDVLASIDCYTTTQIAKELGMSAIKLNKILNACKVQYKVHDQWVMYAKYQDKNYTKTRTASFDHNSGHKGSKPNTVWTEEGRKFIHELIKGLE